MHAFKETCTFRMLIINNIPTQIKQWLNDYYSSDQFRPRWWEISLKRTQQQKERNTSSSSMASIPSSLYCRRVQLLQIWPTPCIAVCLRLDTLISPPSSRHWSFWAHNQWLYKLSFPKSSQLVLSLKTQGTYTLLFLSSSLPAVLSLGVRVIMFINMILKP